MIFVEESLLYKITNTKVGKIKITTEVVKMLIRDKSIDKITIRTIV